MDAPYRLDRALIRVSGPDALAFLNNLLTQDLAPLADAGVMYAALLSPQGKVLTDMFVWADGDDILLDVDPKRATDLSHRLSMYKLRAKVILASDEDTVVVWAPSAFDGALADPRATALGWRGIVRAGAASALADGAAAYDAVRLAFGAPDLAQDAGVEEVFALEALLDELNGVAFQKGCFVGQENVSRMKRRATTRKKFCPVVSNTTFAPSYGAAVRAGATELGTVRSSVGGRAIALLRLDRALEAISGGEQIEADGQPLKLAAPPWLVMPQRQVGGSSQAIDGPGAEG